MHMYICEGQKLALGAVPQDPSMLVFEAGSLTRTPG